jgi:transglutaminase-like putative cysteine protease
MVFATASLGAAAPALAADAASPDEPAPAAPLPDATSHPGADAVVIADEGHVAFVSADDPGHGYLFTRRVRIQVLTPAGRRHGRVVFPADYATRLESWRAHSTHDGVTANVAATALAWFEATGGAGSLYSDTRVGVFDVPAVEPGSTIEYEIVTRHGQVFGLAGWVFDHDVPVQRSRFSVDVPAGWGLTWSYTRDGRVDDLAPTITPHAEGGARLSWERRDLPALEAEPDGLPLDLVAARLAITVAVARRPSPFTTFASWADVGALYRDLTARLAPLAPAGLPADLDATPAPSPSDWVRDRIRYVAITQGIGALRPHGAADVLRAGYGDCKDMVTLLVELYRLQGVVAWPALVATRGHAVFDPDRPAVTAFDHVVVALPGAAGAGLRFVDPTDGDGRDGTLPWPVQGRPALVIRPDGVERVTTPMGGVEANTWRVTWRLARADDEPATLRLWATGTPATGWRSLARAVGEGAPPARLDDAVLHGPAAGVPGARVLASHLVASPDVPADAVYVEATLAVPHAFERLAGGARVLPLGRLFGSAGEVRVPADRRSPVELGPPRRSVHVVVVPLLDGERVEHAPAPAALSTPLGEYTMACEQGAGEVRLIRTLVWRTDHAPAAALHGLRALTERVSADARDALVLRRGAGP